MITQQTPSEQNIRVHGTDRDPFRRPAPCLAVLLLALVFVCERNSVAASAEIDCDSLLEMGLRAGEVPIVTINPSTGSVSLKTRSGTCREAIATWTARDLPSSFFAGQGTEAPAKIEKDEAPRRLIPARPPAAEPVQRVVPAPPRPAEPVKPFETHPLFRSPPAAPAGSERASKPARGEDAVDPSAATDAPEAEKRTTLFESPDLSREFEIKKAVQATPEAEPASDWLGVAIYGAIGSALVLVGGAVAVYLVRRKRPVGDAVDGEVEEEVDE